MQLGKEGLKKIVSHARLDSNPDLCSVQPFKDFVPKSSLKFRRIIYIVYLVYLRHKEVKSCRRQTHLQITANQTKITAVSIQTMNTHNQMCLQSVRGLSTKIWLTVSF